MPGAGREVTACDVEEEEGWERRLSRKDGFSTVRCRPGPGPALLCIPWSQEGSRAAGSAASPRGRENKEGFVHHRQPTRPRSRAGALLLGPVGTWHGPGTLTDPVSSPLLPMQPRAIPSCPEPCGAARARYRWSFPSPTLKPLLQAPGSLCSRVPRPLPSSRRTQTTPVPLSYISQPGSVTTR